MKYTCVCCGYKTLSDYPGSYEICPICFWEDDQIQILDPWYEGGANRPCLSQAQENFAKLGACESSAIPHVRKPLATDHRDPQWRPVRESDRSFVKLPRDMEGADWHILERWYYWCAAA